MNITFGVTLMSIGSTSTAPCVELVAVLLQHDVGDRLHQRVARMQQAGHRRNLRSAGGELFLEADALVAAQHRSALRRSRPVIWRSRSRMMAGVGDLVAPLLAGRSSPPEAAKPRKKARMKKGWSFPASAFPSPP